jgi:hypothetical protein
MTGLLRFIKNLFAMIFKVKPSKKMGKDARKETDHEKDTGGMDSVRDGSSRWFERHSRR